MRLKCILLPAFICLCYIAIGQEYSITGNLLNENSEPIPYATILLSESEDSGVIMGVSSEENGTFVLENVSPKNYIISFSYVGFKTEIRNVTISENTDLGNIILTEDTQMLEETIVSVRKPTLTRESGNLIFNVENTSLSTGSTFDLLKKTPLVLVVEDRIQIKFETPLIFINDKRVYLSQSEAVTLLQNLDASIVKSVEVITNPSSKFDAEAGKIINIITSKGISIGYKGSIAGTYEQAIFSKYAFSTSHFYKNNWLNIYGSYSVRPRKEFKEDENFVSYFTADGNSTKSVWNSLFTRITRSNAHQANLATDFTLNDKNTLSITSNILYAPNTEYDNTVNGEILNAQQQLDSTFVTSSGLENDKYNISINAEHVLKYDETGGTMRTSVNYNTYSNEQLQDVSTTYFAPSNDPIRVNSFFTMSDQKTDIVAGKLDFTIPISESNLETGIKYSNIDTQSGLDFFDTDNGITVFNEELSDLFIYEESIFAAYINFTETWGDFNFTGGLRGEYTDVQGNSRSLGEVNTQEYFELFPSVSLDYSIHENGSLGISYSRKIERPRYQSLNPFRYFLNENSFNGGNPNLVPGIDSKISLNYSTNGKWFFELYYQQIDNSLSTLTFQNNENQTIRNIDSNLIKEFQYSLDAIYSSSINNWWFLNVVTSGFYLEDTFLSVESPEETYSNGTFGFFGQMYSGFTISKKAALTSDVTALYISNLVYGSLDYRNQFSFSVSFRKAFWNNSASLSAGVDDIFNTNNILVTSKYYNQDNSYFARAESRLFRLSFKYNFGNAKLRDNNRTNSSEESERLE